MKRGPESFSGPLDIDLEPGIIVLMTIHTATKKPVTIRLVQWTGANVEEVRELTGSVLFHEVDQEKALEGYGDIFVTAEVYDELHGIWVGVKHYQWIIEGVHGEFYPIDPAVLDETYDLRD